jgi:uncharacterized protein YqeY
MLADRLRGALREAMKSRDRVAVGVLGSALAAIENAQAVDVADGTGRGRAIEQTPVGLGVAEAERRTLTEDEVAEIVRAEAAERQSAARRYDVAGQPERANLLRAEAHVLQAQLSYARRPGAWLRLIHA